MKEYNILFDVGKLSYYKNEVDKNLPWVIFLHGWGSEFSSFNKIIKELKDDYQILGLDFFGFGKSPEADHPLSVDEYTNYLEELIKELKIKNPVIVAHSFGARVAVIYASRNILKSLVLVNPAIIRHKSLKTRYKIVRYKFLKRLYKLFSKSKYLNHISRSGSTDYKNASALMKKTLNLAVNRSLNKEMKMIKIKTYFIWGILDEATPYKNHKLAEKRIKNSKTITFYSSGHFSYIDEEKKFVKVLKTLI